MTEQDRKELIANAIQLWGVDSQFISFAEEMGELLTAVSHMKRGRIRKDALVTEIADVRIMMEEMMFIFGISNQELEDKIDSQFEKFNKNYTSAMNKIE